MSEEYEVEAILDHMIDNDGNDLYLVRWKGYTDADNTWECYQENEDLKNNCSRLISNYHKNIKLKRKQYKIDLEKIRKGTKSFIPLSKKYRNQKSGFVGSTSLILEHILESSDDPENDNQNSNEVSDKEKIPNEELDNDVTHIEKVERNETTTSSNNKNSDEEITIKNKNEQINKNDSDEEITINKRSKKASRGHKFGEDFSDEDYVPEKRIRAPPKQRTIIDITDDSEIFSTTTTETSTEHSDAFTPVNISDNFDDENDYDSQIGSPLPDDHQNDSSFGEDMQMLNDYPPELVYSCKKVFNIIHYYVHSKEKNYCVCADALKAYNPKLIIKFLEPHVIFK